MAKSPAPVHFKNCTEEPAKLSQEEGSKKQIIVPNNAAGGEQCWARGLAEQSRVPDSHSTDIVSNAADQKVIHSQEPEPIQSSTEPSQQAMATSPAATSGPHVANCKSIQGHSAIKEPCRKDYGDKTGPLLDTERDRTDVIAGRQQRSAMWTAGECYGTWEHCFSKAV